ncbi:YecA family protein [Virgibacillus sp. FSP13]
MSKIRRNDPCPCGSGKKYKKCHGASNATGVNPKLINDSLDRLHQEVISFAINNNQNKINEQIKKHDNPFLQDNVETADVYTTGLTMWILLNVPCFTNNQTIFDIFYHHRKATLNQQTSNAFAKWRNTVPSVYEVISVDQLQKRAVTVRDILTEDSFQIPFHDGDDYLEGSLIIGTLVPFANQHNFFYTLIKLYRHDKEVLRKLLQQYTNEIGGLSRNFPNFLADALLLGVDANEWDNPLHEETAQLFAKHMVDKDIHDEIILKGVALWNQYCKAENPSLKKIESYAAALEYLVQKTLLASTSVTQGQLAEEYGASPGTVSTIFRKLSNVLSDDVE